jgi:SH3-like domain-containing protein
MTPRTPRFALGLAFISATAAAATAYVSDELVLNVYAEENNQGQRLATLHSGASVDTLSVSGEYTQVRLADGTTGWVKSAYLTTQEPASFRVKQLEEELERTRATTPALAEAAARSEVDRLNRELALKQAQLDASHSVSTANAEGFGSSSTSSRSLLIGVSSGALLLALGAGFWIGYATLARRVRRKFGGIRVY